MKIYQAKRTGLINYVLIGVLILPIVIFFLDSETFLENPLIMLPLISPLVLILWIYFDTYYKIKNNLLYYHSGFIKGNIDVFEIREIIKGKTMWSGTKPALAQKGLIIKYKRFDEIYIAPESNDEMLHDLLKINPDIEIIES